MAVAQRPQAPDERKMPAKGKLQLKVEKPVADVG
jgi:hypothetical protein